jgi:hypothetical protein
LAEDKILWTKDLGEIYSSGCVWNDTIYLCEGKDNNFYAIDPSNGSIIWTFKIGIPAHSTPSYYNDRLYFTSYERVWCIPATDIDGDGVIAQEDIVWSTYIHDEQGGSSPLLTEGKVYVGSDDGNLYCLDMDSGEIVWNFTTGGYVYSSPALYNGSLYFGSSDGSVYCVGNKLIGLDVELELEKKEMVSNERQTITVTVKDHNGSSVSEARVFIVVSAGDIGPIIDGTRGVGDQDSANENDPEGNNRGGGGKGEEIPWLTDIHGKVIFDYIPPPVTSRSTIEISVTGEKPGMRNGVASILIIVEPSVNEDSDTTSGKVNNLHEKRLPYYVLISTFIIVDIVLAVVIVNSRDQDKGKKEEQVNDSK